jgi:hypothetical protein
VEYHVGAESFRGDQEAQVLPATCANADFLFGQRSNDEMGRNAELEWWTPKRLVSFQVSW